MAHSFRFTARPMEQQKGEMCEGVFEWKLERFLANDRERKSDVFKFGRHNALLRLLDKSTKHFSAIGQSGHRWANFEIKLEIPLLLGLDIFSKVTYYKACFIKCDGSEFFIKDGNIRREETSFHIMLCYEGLMDEEKTELLPDGTLTFRLTWYDYAKRRTVGPLTVEQSTQTPLDLIPEKEPTKLLLTLSKDLERFYENKADTDCVLQIGNVQIPVHRAVLAARSEVFAAMFRHDTSENRSGVVVIQDVDAAILNDVLFYLYSGQIRGLSPETAAAMYAAADKYAMIELRDTCMDLLKNNLTVENVCEAALLAHIHGEVELEEEVAKFMGDQLEDVERTDGWKQLSNNKPSLTIKLLRSALMTTKETVKKLSSK